MTRIEWLVAAVAVLGIGWAVYGMFFNRDLYCRIALMGQINSVPAFCLFDAAGHLIQR